jgi:CBS domain-containing protein
MPSEAQLKEISARLKKGEKIDTITPRELLQWFGAKRRGWHVVREIKDALYNHDLRTDPDFEFEYFDGPIKIELGKAERDRNPNILDIDFGSPDTALPPPTAQVIAFPGVEAQQSRPITTDPTYRIGKLASANTSPVWVKPNSTMASAMTIMLANDFSQLPVMTSERDVKGVVSWESIGARLAVGRQCAEVRECMDDAVVISDNTSLFDAILPIVKNQYVLVRDATNRISGIVTASDLSITFRELAEPFLLLDKIENHLRSLVFRSGFTIDQLRSAADETMPREIDGVSDLTIGEYIRLLEKAESWSQLKLAIDRVVFVKLLDEVRQIRNDVMHFNPDPRKPEDLDPLRKLAVLLQKLRRAGISETQKPSRKETICPE